MENNSLSNDYESNVAAARAWLNGFAEDKGGILKSARYDEDTRAEAGCRRALAQLLADGNAPRDIMHLLAQLIAPNDPIHPKKYGLIGEQVFLTGDPRIILSLTGSDWTVSIRRRDNRRFQDGMLAGSIAQRVHDKRADGMSLEKAFFEVSEEAREAGIEKMSPENVKRIWGAIRRVWD